MELNISFANKSQRQFYYNTQRNQCISGGYNNGKTFIGCFKALTLLLGFPNYRVVIARQRYTDLKRTTMQTFFKMCPTELIASHNEQEGLTQLVNSSMIYWMHLDNVDENSLRGLEPNSILVDQAEETEEKVYNGLDSRLGRWDGAIIPQYLLDANPNWPKNKKGKLIAPSYLMLLTNPDTYYHYIYRKYHPDSIDRRKNYFFVECEWDSSLGSYESYEEVLKNDPEWVAKYVKGQWGVSSAQIHVMPSQSLLEPTDELIARIKSKGNLFRSMDHGDAAPTCVLWFAAIDGVYICYREYYAPGKVISYHRRAITDLSEGEEYSANYADPSIYKKASQKEGGFWCVADEYRTSDTDGPPLFWIAADNNEFATRNRINELLQVSDRFKNPVTGERPSPGLYYIKASSDYPNGCREAIRQLGAQRKKLLGTIDGKSIYSDDRDESVTDHAYDPTRYFVAQHGTQPLAARKRAPRNSFKYFNEIMKQRTGPVPASIQ